MKKYLSIALLGGALVFAGCGDSREDFVITSNNGLVIAPVCVDDNYTVNANSTLTVSAANGVLANDTPNGAIITNFATTSTNGGTVVGNVNGSFTYTPVANFTGPDTFTYTLSNLAGTRTCTVTVAVAAVDGFFVDAANGNDGTGNFTNGLPFATIQAAVTAAGTNQDIVVRPGTYNESVTLLNGQRLLELGSVRPAINGGGITLADGNTVDFIRIQGTPGDAISGNGVNGATMTNCEIANTIGNGSGIEDPSATGAWTISSNSITNVDSLGINITSDTGDNLVLVISQNSITGSDAGALSLTASSNSFQSTQITDNILTGTVSAGGNVELTSIGNANFCLDVEGNTNDDVYCLARLGSTPVLEIEQLSQLLAINNNIGTVENNNGAGVFPATEVSDGSCGF